MKLFELQGYRKLTKPYGKITPGETPLSWLKQRIFDMKNQGDYISKFEVTGGWSANVFIHPESKKVYKVWDIDVGYESYLKAVYQNQGAPGIPKVSKIYKIDIGGHKFKVVSIEKLKPAKGIAGWGLAEVGGQMLMVSGFASRHGVDKKMEFLWMSDLFHHGQKDVVERYKSRLKKVPAPKLIDVYRDVLPISLNEIKKDFPRYYNIGIAMAGFFTAINKSGASGIWDLHKGNVMMRDNGEYVVIDPFE